MTDYHAFHRAAERYGYDLTKGEQRRICAKIVSHDHVPDPECVFVGKQPDGRERWIVWFKGEWTALVYEPISGIIITFLPRNVIRNHRSKLPW